MFCYSSIGRLKVGGGGASKKYEEGIKYLYIYIYRYTYIRIHSLNILASMYTLKIEHLTSSSYFYTSNVHNLLLFFKVVICFATVDRTFQNKVTSLV